jgi:hypothetical protein
MTLTATFCACYGRVYFYNIARRVSRPAAQNGVAVASSCEYTSGRTRERVPLGAPHSWGVAQPAVTDAAHASSVFPCQVYAKE